MPDVKNALIYLGHLIDLMDGNGTVDWMWFANPLRRALNGVPKNRDQIGAIVRALRDQSGASPPFDATTNTVWESYEVITGHLGVGLVWNTQANTPLQIGIGAKVTVGSGKQTFDGTVLGRMVKFPGGDPASATVEQLLPSHELGSVLVGAALPVPDFLNSASISVTIPPPQNAPLVSLTVNDGSAPRMFPVPSNTLAFDAARLAIYVLRAWVRSQAISQAQAAGADGAGGVAFSGSNDSFFARVNNHLFPMLGDPPSSIQPFPLIADAPGTQPNFDNWKNSIFTLNQNAGGALTFIWHLRAVVTGNESESFLEGSYYFPLLEADQPSGPPTGIFQKAGNYPTDAPGKGIFLGLKENGTRDLVIAFRDAGAAEEIVLASMNGGIQRPKLPKGALWGQLKTLLLNFANHAIGTSGKVTVEDLPNGLVVTLFAATPASGIPALDKPYALSAVLREDQPVVFSVKLPFGGIEMPPEIGPLDASAIFTGLLGFIVGSLPATQTDPYKGIAEALLAVVDAKLKGQSIEPLSLIASLLAAAGNDKAIEIGPLTIAADMVGGKPTIKPGLTIGPIKPAKDAPAGALHIGKINAGAQLTVNLAQQTVALTGTYVEIVDLRFGKGGGTGDDSGLLGSLLPDMKQAPGFTFKVAVATWPTVSVDFTGGGKVPLQVSIGPLDLAGLLVDLRKDSLMVGVDLSFQLATITVAAFELGIKVHFDSGSVTPFLHGLGLSMDMKPVKLAGMFAEVKNGNVTDYVGGAVVSVANMFELSAIGAYTQIDGKIPSLFIFASLVAPLGGPPWFFITGIAGGFGYNRSLPPPGLMTQHPFIRVMRGDLTIPAQPSAGMAELSKLFLAQVDQYWVAAGIQFNSFGFINGKLVLAVAFGNKFSIQVLGLASFGIEKIAYFEIGIEASGDNEAFKLKAGVSKNSYLIHPDIASLRGDFGLGVWHGGKYAGDFVFSIGGYHPAFKRPEHYDQLAPVGVNCVVYGFIRLSVDCFFACTPQALMAGAKCSLAAEFSGIGAGLDVYVDVFIRWDPFYIRATMGVTLWFKFMGRHEIGVDLQIWTPPFGGLATIDLAMVSFDVAFGADENHDGTPKLYQFFKRSLGVAATSLSGNKAKVEAYNTATQPGLFRVDFTSGRTTQPQKDDPKQEGIDQPVPMCCEFSYTVRSRLPLAEAKKNGASGLDGKVYLPLCEIMGVKSSLTTSVQGSGTQPKVQGTLSDLFPRATFGDKLGIEAQPSKGAKNAVAKVDTADVSVARAEGFDVRVEAVLTNPSTAMQYNPYEDSTGAERYPLPLGISNPQPWVTRAPIVFKAGAWVNLAVSSGVSRREIADLAIKNYAPPPLVVLVRYADLQRMQIPVRLGGLTVAAPPADAPVIAIPESPARRAEMFAVNLRMTPPKAPFALQRRRLNTLSRARNLRIQPLTPAEGTKESVKSSLTVESGKAILVELTGGNVQRKALTLSGQQTVRAISLGGVGEFLADTYIAGSQQITLHERAERVALIGEGLYPPVNNVGARAVARTTTKEAPPSAAASYNIGVEHDSTLLALAPRVFAGHGCVVSVNSFMPLTAEPLDSVPSFKLLRNATSFEVYLPAVQKGSSLILLAAPAADDPGSALDGVRWVAENAYLSDLTTIVGPNSTAFVMQADAEGPWSVEVSLNHLWRIASFVVSPRGPRDMVNELRRNLEQDLIDDRLQVPGRSTESSVLLEVTQ